VEAGYDPDAAAALFIRMKAHLGEVSRTPAITPAGEVTQSLGEALESYFRSHPASEERASKLADLVAQHRSSFKGRSVYVGRGNLHDQVPRSQREIPAEYRRF
jgi:predicted Zn-dependent protease